MSNKIIKICLVVLAILTTFNFAALLYLNHLEQQPQTSYTTDVLGAVFKQPAEEGVIDVDLVRPPRVAVNPGETATIQNSTITNTGNIPLYFRAAYRVEIRDGEGNKIEDFNDNVFVQFNEGWSEKDGYWYYNGVVEVDAKFAGPIASISYSDAFSEHLDYKVYIPVLIESVEVRDVALEDVNYWPNQDINKVGIENNDATTWTTKITIE